MKSKHNYILVILSIIFFMIYSYLSFSSPVKFISPDEVVNYYYSRIYSQTGELSYYEDLNEIADGTIHPRGAVSIGEKVVSQKYLGFPVISGTVAVIVPELIRFITPILAVLGAVYLYLITRDLFNKRVALLTFIIALISPPYWYWSSLVMFENLAACSIFIVSCRYFFKFFKESKPIYFVLWGLFLGLALFIRPEYIIMCIALLIVMLLLWTRFKKRYVILSAFTFMIALGPLLILNNELYGAPLTTGTHIHYGIESTIQISRFSGSNFFENFLNLANLIPLISLLGVIGLIYCFRERAIRHYAFFLVLIFLLLGIYLLSGTVFTTDVHSSYVRYLLPVFLILLPLISHFIISFYNKYMKILIVMVLVITSISIVLPKIEGNLQSCKGYGSMSSSINSVTAPEAVIFVNYWDKIIFPDRKVCLVNELPTDNRSELLSDIAVRLFENDVPVYILARRELANILDINDFITRLSAKGYVLSPTGCNYLLVMEKQN